MSAVCFRCDWQGRASGDTCPSCGAPLHRVEPHPARDHERETPGIDGDARELPFGPEPDQGAGRGPGRSGFGASLGPVVLVGVIVLLVVAAIEAVSDERSRTRAAQQNEGNADGGRLVYLTRSQSGVAELWILDVTAGEAEPGPTVSSTTVELVDASGAGPDRIGVERRADDGTVRVSVIQGIRPGARIDMLGRGDLVAWGPGGKSLVIARNASGPAPCSPVRMTLVSVVTQEVGWSFHDRDFCGPVTALSRSAAATYLTAPSGDRYGVYLTGVVGMPQLLFEGVALVSGSPLATFLLRGDDVRQEPEALLGWKGIGGPVSIGRGDQALVVERVLAWSPDGAQVAVLGTLGPTSGMYLVEAGSGTGQREPTFVELEEEASDATFDTDGSIYLMAGDGLFVYRAGVVTALPLPDGAPPPAGPIVWIP